MNTIVQYRGRFVERVVSRVPSRVKDSTLIRLDGRLHVVDASEIDEVTEDFNDGYVFGQSAIQHGEDYDSVTKFMKGVSTAYRNGVLSAFVDYEDSKI